MYVSAEIKQRDPLSFRSLREGQAVSSVIRLREDVAILVVDLLVKRSKASLLFAFPMSPGTVAVLGTV